MRSGGVFGLSCKPELVAWWPQSTDKYLTEKEKKMNTNISWNKAINYDLVIRLNIRNIVRIRNCRTSRVMFNWWVVFTKTTQSTRLEKGLFHVFFLGHCVLKGQNPRRKKKRLSLDGIARSLVLWVEPISIRWRIKDQPMTSRSRRGWTDARIEDVIFTSQHYFRRFFYIVFRRFPKWNI